MGISGVVGAICTYMLTFSTGLFEDNDFLGSILAYTHGTLTCFSASEVPNLLYILALTTPISSLNTNTVIDIWSTKEIHIQILELHYTPKR